VKKALFVKALAFAAALALSPAASAQDISRSHMEAASELTKLTEMIKTFDLIVPQLGLRIQNNILRTRPELKKDLDEVLDQLVPEFEKEKDKLIEQTTRFYAEAMSESEIKAVVAFFQTAPGKKYLDTQPTIINRIVVAIDDWNTDLSERMITRVRDEMKKRGHDI